MEDRKCGRHHVMRQETGKLCTLNFYLKLSLLRTEITMNPAKPGSKRDKSDQEFLSIICWNSQHLRVRLYTYLHHVI